MASNANLSVARWSQAHPESPIQTSELNFSISFLTLGTLHCSASVELNAGKRPTESSIAIWEIQTEYSCEIT